MNEPTDEELKRLGIHKITDSGVDFLKESRRIYGEKLISQRYKLRHIAKLGLVACPIGIVGACLLVSLPDAHIVPDFLAGAMAGFCVAGWVISHNLWNRVT